MLQDRTRGSDCGIPVSVITILENLPRDNRRTLLKGPYEGRLEVYNQPCSHLVPPPPPPTACDPVAVVVSVVVPVVAPVVVPLVVPVIVLVVVSCC